MNVTYSKTFVGQAEQLPPKLQARLYERIVLFRDSPHHPQLRNHQFTGKCSAYHSINITGDYRALYLTSGDEVIFDQIGTHSQLYG